MPNRQPSKAAQRSIAIIMSLTQIIQIFFCRTITALTNRIIISKRKHQIISALSRTSRAFASFAIDIRDLSSDY